MFEINLQETIKRDELYEVVGSAIKIAQQLHESALLELHQELTKIHRRIDQLEDRQFGSNIKHNDNE